MASQCVLGGTKHLLDSAAVERVVSEKGGRDAYPGSTMENTKFVVVVREEAIG